MQRYYRSALMSLMLLASVVSLPLQSESAEAKPVAVTQAQSQVITDYLVLQGRDLYEAGQYSQAAKVWQQALLRYRTQGEILNQATVLANLSLAYQQLGRWQEAETSLNNGFELLQRSPNESQSLPIRAQLLDTQGSLQFTIGKRETAIDTWQEAVKLHEQQGDRISQVRTLLNQVQALRTLGFYRRALKTSDTINQILRSQPDSLLKARSLLSLGNTLQAVGDLKEAQQVLEQSLAIAQQANSNPDISAAQFSLGNLAYVQEDWQNASNYYTLAANRTYSPVIKAQAQLNQFSLLIEAKRFDSALQLQRDLQAKFEQLPASHDLLYARINFARNLMKLAKERNIEGGNAGIAGILSTAVQQAKTLEDNRALSYALGTLGQLYEQNQQWQSAQELTQEALGLAQTLNAADISYRWQWQLGRLLKNKGDHQGAIAAYSEAVDTLNVLRGDLIAVNPNSQFSFRESVEPVYRELVSLLLSSPKGQTEQKALEKAQEVIESLQVAELVNFFRADCLTVNPVKIAQVDPQSAVLYPIILEDRIEVILSLPGKPLRHYSASVPRNRVDALLATLRVDLLDTRSRDYLRSSQQVYDWLIRPAADELTQNKVKTLVFVLDGPLRNIPMSALHDGQRYLVQTYNVALTPGLNLLSPKPLSQQPIKAIVAGLAEARQGFSALPHVISELKEIESEVPSQVLLDANFTNANFSQAIAAVPFPVVHLATHGQFSSDADKTFLLTYDGRININQLGQLLQSRSQDAAKTVELLVLSACKTATGDKRAALGLAGMAVRAGARSTVASLWAISDEATSILMTELYRDLADAKLTRAEALRQAQLSLLENKKYDHPYYWAPFVLLGNWL